MAATVPNVSHGWTLSLPTTSVTLQVLDVKPPEISLKNPAIPAGHQGTTAGTVEPLIRGDFLQGGVLTITFHTDGDIDWQAKCGTIETAAVLTDPDGATWTMPGWTSDYQPGTHTLDEKMIDTISFQQSGPWTHSAS